MKIRIPVILSRTMLPESSKGSLPKVEFTNQYHGLEFEPFRLRKFFQAVFSLHQHNLGGELSIVFMDREAHNQLHGKYLKDFRPTDVITFPADQENELAGEICVSVDQAIVESVSRKIPMAEELSLYLIHGWLHIIGFDDLDQIDREVMRLEEDRVMGYIKKLSLWPDFRLAQNLHD
jgi:probable rRNA maturation factor